MNNNYFELEWSFKDSLGETIGEKNEALWLQMYEIRNHMKGGVVSGLLAEHIDYVVFSKSYWNDVVKETWYMQHCPIQEHMPNGMIKVGRMHNSIDVYISDFFDGKQDWVALVSGDKMGRIIIKDFR